MRLFTTLCLAFVFLLTSCASMFMPKKQKVTFTTGNKDAIVYLEKEEIGKGRQFKEKIKKDGTTKQIVVRIPGYKDIYAALPPTHRPAAFFPLQILNAANLFYGLAFDVAIPKNKAYIKELIVPQAIPLVNRTSNDKNIDLSNIRLSIKDKNKDIKFYHVSYSTDATILSDNIKKEEESQAKNDAKAEKKAAKKKSKKGKLEEDKEITYDDTKFSYNVYKTLKMTGFVDTVNAFFGDFNNLIYLEGNITKIHIYSIHAKFDNFLRSKIFMTWYIKNNFNQILDSMVTSEFSGDISYWSNGLQYNDALIKAYGDAIDISYLNLHKNSKFKSLIKIENDFKIKDAALTLQAPKKNAITDKSDASIASVIIKSPNGHGSGFAITQDGYILTNYHVIAGRMGNSNNTFTVITSTGDELVGKVVRYNKYRDIALVKVDKPFDKVFSVNNTRSFKNLQNVLTIGTPKSIELGQSVSTGIISNERKVNNNNLLQLNMSVNSGNSGGPVFDDGGNLHGVIVSKAIGKNTEGISFAIPAYLVADYLNINFR